MHIFYTEKEFEYYHDVTKKMIKTTNRVPFLVNDDGVLIDEVNNFLLMKTELEWDANSRTPTNNAENLIGFLIYCDSNNVNYKNISGIEIRQYIAFQSKTGKSEGTIKTRLSSIQSLYNWLHMKKTITNNPFDEFGKRDVSRVIDVFSSKDLYKTFNISNIKKNIMKDVFIEDIPTEAEIKKLYEYLSDEDKLMALFIIETGVRKEELLQLKRKDINSIRESSTGRSYQLLLNAKTMKIKYNKSRNIIISDALRIKILKHLNSKQYKANLAKSIDKKLIENRDDAFIFISNRGTKYSADKLNKSFDKACSLNGYKEKNGYTISPHQLRHFYASHFIAQREKDGMAIESAYLYLSERLGHSSVNTTKEFYVKMIDKLKQQEKAELYTEKFVSGFLS